MAGAASVVAGARVASARRSASSQRAGNVRSQLPVHHALGPAVRLEHARLERATAQLRPLLVNESRIAVLGEFDVDGVT